MNTFLAFENCLPESWQAGGKKSIKIEADGVITSDTQLWWLMWHVLIFHSGSKLGVLSAHWPTHHPLIDRIKCGSICANIFSSSKTGLNIHRRHSISNSTLWNYVLSPPKDTWAPGWIIKFLLGLRWHYCWDCTAASFIKKRKRLRFTVPKVFRHL